MEHPSNKPSNTSVKVISECDKSVPSATTTNSFFHTPCGDGSRNAGALVRETTICQSATTRKIDANTSQPLCLASHSRPLLGTLVRFRVFSVLSAKKSLEVYSGHMNTQYYRAFIFFYPDFTVDPGIAPSHAPERSWVIPPIGNWEDRSSRTLPRRSCIQLG